MPGPIKLLFRRRKQAEARAIVESYFKELKRLKSIRGNFFRHGFREEERRETLLAFLDQVDIYNWFDIQDDTYLIYLNGINSQYIKKRTLMYFDGFRDYLSFLKEKENIYYDPGRRTKFQKEGAKKGRLAKLKA